MTFVPGQVLTAAELNVLDITSLTVDTDTLVVDATNDRVGINQASPSVALDVGGSVVIDDTLAVDTDTLFTNGAGQVGIGTTTPTANHVLHTHGAVLISSTTGVGNSHFPFTDGRFYYTADPETGGTGDHVFRHYSGGSYVEQMRILENGRVGIGTSSPTAELEVRGASNPEIRIIASDGTDPALYFGDNTDSVRGGLVYDTSNNDLQFRGYNNTTIMTIESDGQVGIGTTSPSYSLDVNNTIRAQAYMRVESGTNEQLSLRATTTSARPYLAFYNWNGSSYVRRGYIGYPNSGSSTSTINLVSDSGNVQITGGSGEVNVSPKLSINNGPELSDPGAANELRVTTAYGYIDLGPKNSSYCHIYTDRTRFYLNQGINSAPYFYWRNNSGIAGPLLDTSSTSGYRYVLQNQTFGTFFDYTSVRDRKDQITNVTAEDSGRWIDALQPVTYIERWLGEGDEPDDARAWREADIQVGFIADDILANADTDHFSQVLDNGEGGLDPAGWKWECVIAAAVAEIKSLRARVATLESA